MTDKDRGTYSPPTEDSLSYETRRPAGRDKAPITLIISGIFLVLLLLAVVLFYNSGLNSHGRTPPEVGDAIGDIKDGKVEDAKPLSDDQMSVDDGSGAKFAPGSETPLRDDSASAGVATTEAPAPVAPITGPLPSQANNSVITGQPAASVAPLKPPVQAVTPSSSASSTSSIAAAKPAPAAKLPPVAKTAPPAKELADADAPKPAAKGGSAVQIGAFDSTDIANKQYASVASSYGLFLSGTSKHIEKVETPKGTFYRTSFTGFSTPDKARSFCSALKAAGHDCIVK